MTFPPRYTGDRPAVLALVRVVARGLQLQERGWELRAAPSSCGFCVRARMICICTQGNAPTCFGKEGGDIFQRVGVCGGNGDCNVGMDVDVSSYVPTTFGTFGLCFLGKEATFLHLI